MYIFVQNTLLEFTLYMRLLGYFQPNVYKILTAFE